MRGKKVSELVEAAIEGDVESFTELCLRYYSAMVAIAHSVTGDRHLAEDAAQQTFAKIIRRLGQLRDRDKFGVWLGVICRNVARDVVKDLERGAIAVDCVERSTDRVDSEENDSIETVRKAIRKLPDTDREVIYLRYYDGMTYGQMSSVLGISEQAINGRLRRAKGKIGQYLRNVDLGPV